MRRHMRRRALPALLLALALCAPGPALAHGTGSRWLEHGPRPLAVLFHYSTGEPMAWVGVKVYGPGDTAMEYQDARTDKAGVFAFVPDREGAWRVEAKDDQGHLAVAETSVGPGMAARPGPGSATAGGAPLRSAALGLSLLLNLALGGVLLRRKRASARVS